MELTFFELLTPITYWLLIAMWTFILCFYLKRILSDWHQGGLMLVLFVILTIDAFRTLFESVYFGAWYTARVELLPIRIHDFLVQPQMVIIPKLMNVFAAGLIITILFRYWLPKEGEEIKHLEATVNLRTRELSKTVQKLESEIEHRKQMEGKLKESETRYMDLYENAPDMYASVNAETARIDACNMTLANTLGYAKEEIVGHPVYNIYHPDCLEDAKKAFQSFIETGKLDNRELQLRRKDGSKLDVSLNVSAVRGENGQILSSRSTLRDITKRKRVEQELDEHREHLEELVRERTRELEAANRELEAFAYSVSHDLRAPLRHIDGFIELLQENATAALDEQSRHYMGIISESAGKMGQLINDLLSFSRTGRRELSFQKVALGPLVQDVIRDLEPDISGRNVQWHIGELPVVNGDATMLRIVLTNLISNALKFTRYRSQADIEIGSQPGRKSEAVVFVRDNGVGFDMAYVDRLFCVFQRLHRAEEFEGTGIGLANVQRIIARHGGSPWAEGKVDQGATFFFSLPQRSRIIEDS